MMIRNGHTIDVYRETGAGRDRHGDRITELVGTISNVVFAWGSATPQDAGEEFAYMAMDVYCPRNADIVLRAGDRFKLNNDTYAVIATTWNEDNPTTGYNFGYYEAQVTVMS